MVWPSYCATCLVNGVKSATYSSMPGRSSSGSTRPWSMKLGNENGEDCETSMVSPPANIVTSLVGWSLNEEIVESTGTPQSCSNCAEIFE